MDGPQPIGYQATISAPHMHAACLQFLADHLVPGSKALDVGSGSGYLTTAMAVMVQPGGKAVGVEHIPELVERSREAAQRVPSAAGLMDNGALSFQITDGMLGLPEHAPYNAIHVGAAAHEIPEPLLDQLAPGGRMVVPVGPVGGRQLLKVIDRLMDGRLVHRNAMGVQYVPLTTREKQLGG